MWTEKVDLVERTLDPGARLVEHVRVNHRCAHVIVWTDSAIEDLNAIGESLVELPEPKPKKKKK
jgi:hypothetical protein